MVKQEKVVVKSKINIVKHLIIVLVVIAAMLLPFTEQKPVLNDILKISAETVFYIIIVYFNIFFLFPRYMKVNSMWNYFFFLLLSVILLTPIKGLIVYFLYSNDHEQQREIVLNLHYTFLSLFTIAGISTVIKILYEWFLYQRDRKRLEKENMQSELKFLKNQINPHFLFNTLNNVYALSLIKSDKTPEIILKLSDLLRYMLYECNGPKVLLKNEISYLHNYLELEKLRQKENTEIEFIVEGEPEDIKIPPMLFTPFVENAFKHGINKVIDGACIKMKMKIKDESIQFTIENSKPEFTQEHFEKKIQGGIGLANVKKRLELLFNDKYTLEIENTLRNYKIELFLNLN